MVEVVPGVVNPSCQRLDLKLLKATISEKPVLGEPNKELSERETMRLVREILSGHLRPRTLQLREAVESQRVRRDATSHRRIDTPIEGYFAVPPNVPFRAVQDNNQDGVSRVLLGRPLGSAISGLPSIWTPTTNDYQQMRPIWS